jgi:hypothetical protein
MPEPMTTASGTSFEKSQLLAARSGSMRGERTARENAWIPITGGARIAAHLQASSRRGRAGHIGVRRKVEAAERGLSKSRARPRAGCSRRRRAWRRSRRPRNAIAAPDHANTGDNPRLIEARNRARRSEPSARALLVPLPPALLTVPLPTESSPLLSLSRRAARTEQRTAQSK